MSVATPPKLVHLSALHPSHLALSFRSKYHEPSRKIPTDCAPVPVVANVAVALRAAVMETTQVPVPVHAPLQPEKVEPAAGVAVSVTLVPLV